MWLKPVEYECKARAAGNTILIKNSKVKIQKKCASGFFIHYIEASVLNMFFKYFPVFFIVCLLFACNGRGENSSVKKHVSNKLKSPISHKNSQPHKSFAPVLGYRFVITGDFNGDGKKETLTEHYFSNITHQETNKFYEGLDYDSLVTLTFKKKPHSFITCDDKLINSLNISDEVYSLGVSYLKNEGDLNGDGTDEVSYVINWADWSSVNTWHIVTYKNGKWRDLYSFAIRDWQLPDLPETYNQYGMIGLEQKIVNTADTAANKKIERRLTNYKGLVRKLAGNKIKVFYVTGEGIPDTMVVHLKK